MYLEGKRGCRGIAKVAGFDIGYHSISTPLERIRCNLECSLPQVIKFQNHLFCFTQTARPIGPSWSLYNSSWPFQGEILFRYILDRRGKCRYHARYAKHSSSLSHPSRALTVQTRLLIPSEPSPSEPANAESTGFRRDVSTGPAGQTSESSRP